MQNIIFNEGKVSDSCQIIFNVFRHIFVAFFKLKIQFFGILKNI